MRTLGLAFIALFSVLTFAQPDESTLSERLEQLEREVREIQSSPPAEPAVSLKSPFEWRLRKPPQRLTGLGPVASKIYYAPDAEWVLGLSSEFFSFKQINGMTGTTPNVNRTNITSVAPHLGIRLTKRLLFNSQFIFESGGAESTDTVTLQKGQTVVRMAYLDWLTHDDGRSGVRVGHQLIPIGTVNTSNDPTTYFGVLRPELERELIPSLWHENGVSLWIDHAHAEVQIGAFNSLNSAGFRKDTFLAGGRSQGQNAPADDLMGVLRIGARHQNFQIGVSAAFGNTAQKSPSLRSGGFQLGEAHAQFTLPRFQAFAMLAQGELQDADAISVLNSTVIGEQAKGYYGQLAYDVLGGAQKLWVFARYSHYNLHDRVPDGLDADPALNKTAATTGISYFPLPGLVFKADYSAKKSAAANDEDEFNIGAGLIF